MPLGCEERDQELLMYVHGALPPLKRAVIWLHTRHCASCRQRKQEFAKTRRFLTTQLHPMGLAVAAPILSRWNLTKWSIASAVAVSAVALAWNFYESPLMRPPEPETAPATRMSQVCSNCHAPQEEIHLKRSPDNKVPKHWSGTPADLKAFAKIAAERKASQTKGK